MNFIIPLLAVGSLAFVASRKINRLGNLRVQFRDLANVKVSLLQTSLDLRINLINPENSTIIVNSIFSDVFLNGTKVSLINANFGQNILPRQTVTLKIPVQISNTGLIQSVIQKVTTGEIRSIQLSFVGFVDTNLGRINFNEIQEFSL